MHTNDRYIGDAWRQLALRGACLAVRHSRLFEVAPTDSVPFAWPHLLGESRVSALFPEGFLFLSSDVALKQNYFVMRTHINTTNRT